MSSATAKSKNKEYFAIYWFYDFYNPSTPGGCFYYFGVVEGKHEAIVLNKAKETFKKDILAFEKQGSGGFIIEPIENRFPQQWRYFLEVKNYLLQGQQGFYTPNGLMKELETK